MAKLNAKYELMAVYSLAKGEEVAKELVEKFKSKIEAAAACGAEQPACDRAHE